MHRPELTGAEAEEKAMNTMSDLFGSLRGALACALVARAWVTACVESLRRVQEPNYVQVRRLNGITGKLHAGPQQLVYQSMTRAGEVDLRGDSATDASTATPTTR